MIVNDKKKIPEQTGIDSDFNPEIKDILSQKYSSKEETHKKYESECLRILKEYPEQLKPVFNWEYCELEFDFLGFIDQYYSETVPADFTELILAVIRQYRHAISREIKNILGLIMQFR